MKQYFDNTFFKFLFGFLAILFLSLIILLALRLWQADHETPDTSTNVTYSISQ